MGSLALLGFSILSSLGAILLPWLKNTFHWSMRKLWIGGLIWFVASMWWIGWVQTPWLVIVAIANVGWSWAVTMWIPYSLVGEALHPDDTTTETMTPTTIAYRRSFDVEGAYQRVRSFSLTENAPLTFDSDLDRVSRVSLSTGTIMGIHNAYIVLPQLLSSMLSSVLFETFHALPDHQAISWVWRICGTLSLISIGLLGMESVRE